VIEDRFGIHSSKDYRNSNHPKNEKKNRYDIFLKDPSNLAALNDNMHYIIPTMG